MQVAEAVSDATAFDPSGRPAYALRRGRRYVLYDSEVEGGARDGALKAVCPLDDILPRYRGQPLEQERLLVTHIGGLGDGIVLLSCLRALQQRYPDCTVELSCPALHHPLLRLFGPDCAPIGYPPPASELKHYAYYLSLEDVGTFDDPRSGNMEVFARCLHAPVPTEPVRLSLPDALRSQWDPGRVDVPRIAIAMTKSHFMRAYPLDLVLQLTRILLEAGTAVALFGRSAEIGHELPQAPPLLLNLVDRTPEVGGLAATLSHMDALICPDSLFMHLGGVLHISTLALFSSSPTRVAEGYPTVRPMTADVPCRPCGAIADSCPAGYDQCVVPRHPDLDPHRVAEEALRLMPIDGDISRAGQSIPLPVE